MENIVKSKKVIICGKEIELKKLEKYTIRISKPKVLFIYRDTELY